MDVAIPEDVSRPGAGALATGTIGRLLTVLRFVYGVSVVS